MTREKSESLTLASKLKSSKFVVQFKNTFKQQMRTQINQLLETESIGQVIIAEVKIRAGLEILLGTRLDPFKQTYQVKKDRTHKPYRGLFYQRELFKMQIFNILNAHRYIEDPMIHVYEDQFERSEASGWFLSCDLLDGFSPGEVLMTSQLSKEKMRGIRDQLA